MPEAPVVRFGDTSVVLCGEAGQGIQTISSIIASTFVRHDFYVFVNQDFESRIRGGHNFDQVRISNTPVRAAAGQVHILIALDEVTTGQEKLRRRSRRDRRSRHRRGR